MTVISILMMMEITTALAHLIQVNWGMSYVMYIHRNYRLSGNDKYNNYKKFG